MPPKKSKIKKQKTKTARKINKKKTPKKSKNKSPKITTQAAPVAKGSRVNQKKASDRPRLVAHREHLSQVFFGEGESFQSGSYPIQAGLQATFPWLFSQAQNYEHYKFRRLALEYVPSCSTSTSGRIMTTFVMDVTAYPFIDLDEQFDYSGTKVIQPWMAQYHTLPNSSPPKYLNRSAGVGGDLHLYDQATLVWSAEPGSIIPESKLVFGDIYLDYEVEFWTPKAAASDEVATTMSISNSEVAVNTHSPLGFINGNLSNPPTKDQYSSTANNAGIAFGNNIVTSETETHTILTIYPPEGTASVIMTEHLQFGDTKFGTVNPVGDLVSNVTNVGYPNKVGTAQQTGDSYFSTPTGANYFHQLDGSVWWDLIDPALPIILSYASAGTPISPAAGAFLKFTCNYLSARVREYLISTPNAPMDDYKRHWRFKAQVDPNRDKFLEHANSIYASHKRTIGHAFIRTNKGSYPVRRRQKLIIVPPPSYDHLYGDYREKKRETESSEKETRIIRDVLRERKVSEDEDYQVVTSGLGFKSLGQPPILTKTSSAAAAQASAGWFDSLARSKSPGKF